MKQFDYFWASALVRITGTVFFFQLLVEVTGITIRKPGYEWVIWACGGIFVALLLYVAVLIIVNIWRQNHPFK